MTTNVLAVTLDCVFDWYIQFADAAQHHKILHDANLGEKIKRYSFY